MSKFSRVLWLIFGIALIISGIMKQVKERYQNGEITKKVTEKILTDLFELDEDDIYWKFEAWKGREKYEDFENSVAKAYETGKIDDRDDIKKAIEELENHGVDKGEIAKKLTDLYRGEYLGLKKSGKVADLKNLLLSVYMMSGYSYSESTKKLENWEKWEKEKEKEEKQNKS